MKTFEWTDDFNTRLPTVDDQHHRLVDLINGLGTSFGDHHVDRDQMETLFFELAEYARKHFDDEEQLMESSGIDRRHIERHKNIHARFLNDLNALYSAGGEHIEGSGRDVLDYLTHWLTLHILRQDQDMARQILAVEEGMDPAEAYGRFERPRDEAVEPLLAALNRMLKQLADRNQALIELNRTLEARVAERTAELSNANQELKALSLTDALTGLANRRHAMLQLETLWIESGQRREPIAALMVDADHFKEVNDHQGHTAGDRVLVELARALKATIRTDDLVFRLGGDEFLVLCPATDLEGAMRVAEALVECVDELRVAVHGGAWENSISIGVATSAPGVDGFNELIKLADDSLYLAKQAGRGCARSIQLTDKPH